MKFNKKKNQRVKYCPWPRVSTPYHCKYCPIDKPHKHITKHVPIFTDDHLKFIHSSKVVMKEPKT
jgi:hypothetical protein